MRSVYDFVETQRAEPCLDAVLPLSQKNYDHVSGGQKSHYNEPHWWKKLTSTISCQSFGNESKGLGA